MQKVIIILVLLITISTVCGEIFKSFLQKDFFWTFYSSLNKKKHHQI